MVANATSISSLATKNSGLVTITFVHRLNFRRYLMSEHGLLSHKLADNPVAGKQAYKLHVSLKYCCLLNQVVLLATEVQQCRMKFHRMSAPALE